MKKWKAIIGVVLVFVLGAAAGGLITLKMCRHGMWQRPSVEAVVHKMDRKLGLDPQQKTQIEAVMRDARQEMQSVREEAKPRIDKIMADTEDKVRAILRPDQRSKYEEMLRHWKEKRADGRRNGWRH